MRARVRRGTRLVNQRFAVDVLGGLTTLTLAGGRLQRLSGFQHPEVNSSRRRAPFGFEKFLEELLRITIRPSLFN